MGDCLQTQRDGFLEGAVDKAAPAGEISQGNSCIEASRNPDDLHHGTPDYRISLPSCGMRRPARGAVLLAWANRRCWASTTKKRGRLSQRPTPRHERTALSLFSSGLLDFDAQSDVRRVIEPDPEVVVSWGKALLVR